MYNKVILVGNMTRDIELRYSQGGMGIAKTALATTRKFTVNGEKKEDVCFVDITFFGRSAEVSNQYLRKGSKILIEGRLNFEQWVDQEGQKRSKHSVTVEVMQMLDTKQGLENREQNQQAKQAQYQEPPQQQYQPAQYGNPNKPQTPPTVYQNAQGQLMDEHGNILPQQYQQR